MDINELETYRLSDAVKFHDRLNPAIWGPDEQMLPDVREKLLAIADDFRESLGIDVEVTDITVSGSNAAYTYTPNSDIDLHLVADLPLADESEVYRELFDAKKYQYNDQHDFKIGGYDVELYVQDARQPHVSQGIYSVQDDRWIRVSNRRRPTVDDISVRSKYEDLGERIDAAIESGDIERMDALAAKIRDMRQAGLAKTGEFGPENLAFKILRNNGTLERLRNARLEAKNQLMSLEERRKKKAKKKTRYAYGGYWFPGYHYYGDTGAATDGGGDGGGGGESVRESTESQQDIIERFARSCADFLGMERAPAIKLRRDPEWTRRNGTFGRYTADPYHRIEIATHGRHIIDILRTLAHEMTHARQNEVTGLPDHAGETGSEYEDQANAMAGRIMRHWAESEPEMFTDVDLDEDLRRGAAGLAAASCIAGTPGCATTQGPSVADALRTVQTVGRAAPNLPTRAGAEEELRQELRNMLRRQRGEPEVPSKVFKEASGYIPTAKEKDDPRFSMALTVDVHPGQTGKEANKLGLKTDSQGRPALLMKKLNNLLEEVKLDEKCWDGYRKQGMKKKGDRMVPNCVPVAEDEELTEVKMSPAEFQKFLKSPAAEGIRAGFEAELIFRDTQSDPDGDSDEAEADWDADERAGDIDDIINFFTSGDNQISMRAAQRLQDQLSEAFMDWAQQQFTDEYFDLARFQEWADDTLWPDMDDQYRDQARDNLDDPDATDEQIEKEAVSLFHDDVERDWDRSGEWYDRAREELYDEYYGDLDQADWLDQAGLSYMSDIHREYDVDWPHYRYISSGGGGSRDWQEIANSLERVTGMPVRVSSGYHGAARREGQYVIEPDSSLDPDDSEDFGLEVISPPLPLPEAVEQLNKIIDWANGPGSAYTNSSTGLHMGVSLPFRGGDVDPVKLILFMGDRNILDTFDRQSNSYARSAYERLESRIRGMKNAGPKQISGIMDLMKNNLIELADRELKKGVLGDKYVSVNPHDGYIEFRGPGGDYLAKSDEIDGVLENTMLRLAYAMSIAGDNSAHRNEYAKKLYKALTAGDRDNPFMRLFADYSAGMLSGEELKARWADTVMAAERSNVEDVPLYTATGEYEVFDRSTGTRGDRDSYQVIDTFRAGSDNEAMEIAMNRWAGRGIDFGVRVKVEELRTEKPKSRRAELAKRVTRSTRDVGEQLWRVNHHSSQRWVIARSQAEAVEKAVQQDRMFDSPETRARIATDLEKQQWQLDQQARALRQRDSDQDAADIRARLGAPQPAGGASTGEWSVRDRAGALVTTLRPPEAMQSQTGAERYAQNWIARSRPDLDASDITVTQLTTEPEPIPGSTLDIQRQRQQAAQQSQGEFTGRWEIRDAQGRLLNLFGGIGNSQADANRFAAGWLGRNRPDLTGQEVEVVPVMR
jgi:hypothetical protein